MKRKLTKRQAKELRRVVKEHYFHGSLTRTRYSIYKKLFMRGYVVGVRTPVLSENGKAFVYNWHNELTAKGRKALGVQP